MVNDLLRGQIRQTTLAFLTDRCTVSREASTAGAFGEQIRHWTLVMEDIPCRVIKTAFDRNQKIEEVANQESAPEVYSVILPLDAVEVQAKDRIEVNGQTLRVVQVQRDLSDRLFQRVQAVARD